MRAGSFNYKCVRGCVRVRIGVKRKSPDGIQVISGPRQTASVFYYIFASSNKAKNNKESPDMKGTKQNIPSVRPTQSRSAERNFSPAVLIERQSRYIRVTNQIEDMLK